MPEKLIQEYLFQRIKETLSPGQSLVDVVAEVLHVSQDSAYRRIRGETLLVLEESATLCRHFAISLDTLLNITRSTVCFHNEETGTAHKDFENYLKGILSRLQDLEGFYQKQIIYLTKDIPLFHQFSHTSVLAFRYFFWMKTMFEHPEFAGKKFSFDCLPVKVEELGRQILAIYCRIPSIEIWNTEGINSILQQIAYSLETGMMTKEDAAIIHDGLRKTMEHLQLQSEYGRKFLPGENPHTKKDNFQLFFNRVGLGDTTIMTNCEGQKSVYLNYDVLNYLATDDVDYCGQVWQRLKTIMRRSTLISGVSEKQRNMFFNILNGKIPPTGMNKKNLVL